MGRRPCCEKVGLNKGGWTSAEDEMLIAYIKANGEGKWRDLPKKAGLKRCGKSCRLRWLNYLNPKIIRGNITPEEEELIVKLHKHIGNRWSLIAGWMPGRTDNEIKNYWNTVLHKKVQGDQSSFAPPKRKPGKKSHKKNISSPVIPQAIHQPALVHPSVMVPCTEAAILTLEQQAPSQSYLSPAFQSLDDSVTKLGSGEDRGVEDMDKYYKFLLDEDINLLSWDESLSDISLELAFPSDDAMFDYWMGNAPIEHDNLYNNVNDDQIT